MRSIARVLINHLRRLSQISDDEWRATTAEQIKLCLQLTCEVVVVLWWKALRRDGHNFQPFSQSMINFIQVLAGDKRHKQLCRNIEVAGPLVLAVAAAGEAASEEHERDLLRWFLATLYSSHYRDTVKEWVKSYPVRAAMIVRVQREYDSNIALEARLRAADNLMGIADKDLIFKQEHKYGILFKLIGATKQGDPNAQALYKQAESKLGHHPVWQKCAGLLGAGRIPVVHRVSKPICEKCFVSLPVRHKHELEKGEIILCPNCGAILIFGKLP